MSDSEKHRITKGALVAQGESFASIARKTGHSRQYVREVAMGTRKNPKIRSALQRVLKRSPLGDLPPAA